MQAEEIVARATESGRPEEWMALFLAALEETADPEESADIADDAVEEMP